MKHPLYNTVKFEKLEEQKLTPYTQKANELLSELNTDKQNGLSSAEVLVRKGKYGANKLREKKKKTTKSGGAK